jgi:hypothetical protein
MVQQVKKFVLRSVLHLDECSCNMPGTPYDLDAVRSVSAIFVIYST